LRRKLWQKKAFLYVKLAFIIYSLKILLFRNMEPKQKLEILPTQALRSLPPPTPKGSILVSGQPGLVREDCKVKARKGGWKTQWPKARDSRREK